MRPLSAAARTDSPSAAANATQRCDTSSTAPARSAGRWARVYSKPAARSCSSRAASMGARSPRTACASGHRRAGERCAIPVVAHPRELTFDRRRRRRAGDEEPRHGRRARPRSCRLRRPSTARRLRAERRRKRAARVAPLRQHARHVRADGGRPSRARRRASAQPADGRELRHRTRAARRRRRRYGVCGRPRCRRRSQQSLRRRHGAQVREAHPEPPQRARGGMRTAMRSGACSAGARAPKPQPFLRPPASSADSGLRARSASGCAFADVEGVATSRRLDVSKPRARRGEFGSRTISTARSCCSDGCTAFRRR